MTEEIHNILNEIGYSLQDCGQSWRTQPLYRESGNKTSLCIRKENGGWVDFSANIGGSFEELVKISLKLKNLDDAKKWLETKIDLDGLVKIHKPKIKIPKIYSNDTLKAVLPIHDYWLKRGVSQETLIFFRGGLVKRGQMLDRYVFPVFDARERLVGFAGRDVTNTKDIKWKLIGSKMGWSYPLFFNLDIVKAKKEIILVESIGDMLALWEAGIKNTLVLFGVDLGDRLRVLLKLDPDNIIIALNNDQEKDINTGLIAATDIKKELHRYFDTDQVTISLPPKKDFGESGSEEIIDWYESTKALLMREL